MATTFNKLHFCKRKKHCVNNKIVAQVGNRNKNKKLNSSIDNYPVEFDFMPRKNSTFKNFVG